jgi:hypothetical protein
MDEDPSNEAYVLSLLEGYGTYGADVMDIEPAPVKADCEDHVWFEDRWMVTSLCDE